MKKMFIRIMVFVVVAMMAGGVRAQQLSEQEAKGRAMRYLATRDKALARHISHSSYSRTPAPPRPRTSAPELTSVRVEARGIYAFNCEGGGYVIASADSRALPVLGYSDTGSIDWERMPENMRSWLRQYDEAIATLGDRSDFEDGDCLMGRATTRTPRVAIEPLIKTRWNQLAPYYNSCPLYDGADRELAGKRCVTGCVATSMAQVMNYFQWPETVDDGVPGYDLTTTHENVEKVWHIDALPPVNFEWEDMLDCYEQIVPGSEEKTILGTKAQQKAVATLMRYCGQAVEMNYSPKASASSPDAQRIALFRHFGYTTATLIGHRKFYGIDEWEDIIYRELAANRPVLYYGASDDEGHSFICDGYDGDGLFHINWGWNGVDDGFFSLSVLNPHNNTSPGAGSSGIGFSINQGAIIYLDPTMEPQPDPAEGKPELCQYTSMSLEDDHTVKFMFAYRKDDAGIAAVDNALGIRGENGQMIPRFMGDLNDSIVYSNNYMLVEIDSMAFQPGESLRLYPMLRFRHGDNTEWQMIPPDDYSVDAGRTEEGAFYIHIVNNDDLWLQCRGGAITKGTGVTGERSDVTVTVSNDKEQDYIGELYLVPYYGEQEGDPMVCGAYLRAGQEGEVTFSFNPLRSGPVSLILTTSSGQPLGSFTLEILDATGISSLLVPPHPTLLTPHSTLLTPRYSLLLPKGIYIQDGKKFLMK